ncbi:hypothetical protein J3E69DRAFT_231840 [Trichoderma sp. SZMC 28015]
MPPTDLVGSRYPRLGTCFGGIQGNTARTILVQGTTDERVPPCKAACRVRLFAESKCPLRGNFQAVAW